MAAQPAHKALKFAEDDLRKLIKSVERLVRHKHHFTQELTTIKSRLDELRLVVGDLTQTIESFKFRLVIKEVGDLREKLKDHMQLCANFSSERDSLKESSYTKQLDELDKSLKEHIHILKGEKPKSPKRTGVLETVRGGVETLIHTNGPEETGIMAQLKNAAAHVLEPLIHTNPPEELTAKALFDKLYGCVQTLINNKDNFRKELGNIKSRLDDLKPLQVNYIEKIDDFNDKKLHFSIKEVEEYKKELSKAKKVCEDFSKEDNSLQKSLLGDKLYELNRGLKKQLENLTAKKRKGRTSFRLW